MFLQDDDFRQIVADALKVDVAELAQYWDRQCQQAHISAYKDIRGALITRGFGPGQVDAWDRGAEFEQDIGLFWAFTRGVGAKAIDPAVLDALDRRAELASVHVEVPGGNPQPPQGTPPAVVGGFMDVGRQGAGCGTGPAQSPCGSFWPYGCDPGYEWGC